MDAGVLGGTVVPSSSWTCSTRPDFNSYSMLFRVTVTTLEGLRVPHTHENEVQ